MDLLRNQWGFPQKAHLSRFLEKKKISNFGLSGFQIYSIILQILSLTASCSSHYWQALPCALGNQSFIPTWIKIRATKPGTDDEAGLGDGVGSVREQSHLHTAERCSSRNGWGKWGRSCQRQQLSDVCGDLVVDFYSWCMGEKGALKDLVQRLARIKNPSWP